MLDKMGVKEIKRRPLTIDGRPRPLRFAALQPGTRSTDPRSTARSSPKRGGTGSPLPMR